jgi:CHAT domain-containing protein/Tfp pilus assembly protein PilF
MRRGELRIALAAAVAAVVVACLGDPVRAETSGLDPRLETAIALYREDGAASALADFERLAREFAKGDHTRDLAAALHYVGESHWRLGDYEKAREHLDRALAVERAAGDRIGEGKTLNVLGLLAWDEGEYDLAIERFRDASEIGRALGDRRLEGASLNNQGLVQDELGDYEASLQSYRKALEIYRGADFPRGEGDTLGNIGGVHLLLGRFREAMRHYEQALGISETLRSTASMSQDHGNIGLCLMGLGEIDAALERFERAATLAAQAGMRQDEAYWTRHKGNALVHKGRYDSGLEAYRAALDIYESMGAKAELAGGVHDLGRLYLRLGDPDSAERSFRRALELSRSIGLARGVTTNQLALGDLELRRQRLDRAAAHYEQALRRATGAGERHVQADSLLRLALVHRRQQQLAQSSAEVRQALVIAREIEARPVEAEALLGGAELDRLRGRIAAALEGYTAAQSALATSGDPDLLWQVHYGRALALEARGELVAAVAELTNAVTLIEGVRSRLQEPRFRAGYVEDKYEVYIELVRLQLQLGRTEAAFHTAERLRARSYAELLGGRVAAPMSVEERKKENALRERVRRLQQAIRDEDTAERPAQRQRAVYLLMNELLLAERDYQAFLDDRVGRAGPIAAAMAVPLLPERIRGLLREGEALVEYLVGAETLVAFVVTPQAVTAQTLAIRRPDLNARVTLLRDLIQRPGDDRWVKPAQGLSAALIEPIEAAGAFDGVRHLYLVPHGVLNHLPFALLVRERDGARSLLIDRYTLAHLPTAAALQERTSRPGQPPSLLALAPARSRLRHAPDEARSVHAMFGAGSRLLLGDKATESSFKKLAGDYRVLHLATHGEFNSFNPLMSGLELEADALDDGLLQIHEILGLRLDADLVTLSACETALGSGYFTDVPATDELVGMTRAFLAAGSSTVMATLWEIDDRATVGFMKRFYDRMNSAGTDAGAANALARTQRELRSSREHAHPYFWAPYVVAGMATGVGSERPERLGGTQ